jgi:hypothetical protein
VRFFFEDELDASLATAESLADYMEVFAFDGPIGAFGQKSIQIDDAGRLLVDFSPNCDGPREIFRESRKIYCEIIAAIAQGNGEPFEDSLRRLAHRYWVEGEAMAIARVAAPTATRPHGTL